jgi:hypothetical protein
MTIYGITVEMDTLDEAAALIEAIRQHEREDQAEYRTQLKRAYWRKAQHRSRARRRAKA